MGCADIPGGSSGLTTRATIFLRLNATGDAPRELAWEEFRTRYAPVIAGFARNLGAKAQDVDDLVQDVMLGFFANSPHFVYDPSVGRFRGYLKVCTLNALRKRLGRDRKFASVSLDDVDERSVAVEQAWTRAWDHELLQLALKTVRAEYQSNVTFVAFEEYVIKARPPSDVASQLGISIDSVYKSKERVTEAVRRKLRELDTDLG
jgi:RNA polymerase sigma factor (sigma-70 family)